MAEAAQAVEEVIGDLLPAEAGGAEARVFEAMRYAILNGGKRLRPFLVLSTSQLFHVAERCALRAAAAVEMVHSYSLVQDDQPSMDDDELRRGKPYCHVKYD